MAEFTASHTRTQTVIADADRLVLEGVGKIIFALGHGSYKDADALSWTQGLDVVLDSDDFSIEAQGDLPAVGWQMIRNWVLDDL